MGYFLLGVLIGWLVPRPKFIGKAEIAIWSPIKKKLPKIFIDENSFFSFLKNKFLDPFIIQSGFDEKQFGPGGQVIQSYPKE